MEESWLRINLLSIIGACLGFLSLFFAWVTAPFSTDVVGESAFRFNINEAYPAILIFLIGSSIAMISPLGGIVQAIAVIGHIMYLATEPLYAIIPAMDIITQAPGIVLGGVASAITLGGLFRRFALEARMRDFRSSKRLLSVARETESVDERKEPQTRHGFLSERVFSVGSVNILAVVGSIVGISSITLVWLVGEWPYLPSEDMGSLILGASKWEFIPDTAYIAGIVFLAGSVAAIVTYLGAVVQLGGLVLFWAIVRNSLGSYTTAGYYEELTGEISLGAGFFVAIASLIITCSSYALRSRLEVRLPRFSGPAGLFVWSRSSKTAGSPVSSSLAPGATVYSLNVLCLLGAVLGVISLLGAWGVMGPDYWRVLFSDSESLPVHQMCFGRLPTVVSTDLLGISYYPLASQIGMVIFLIGLAVSISSQTGGALQLAGLVLLGYGAFDNYDAYSSGSPLFVFGPGYFLAITSAILVLVSIFVRVKMSFRTSAIHRLGRYFVFSENVKTSAREATASRFTFAARSRWSLALSPMVLVIVASLAALVALSLPWVITADESYSLWDVLLAYQQSKYYGWYSIEPIVPIAYLLLCGALLALFTPLGSLLQGFSVTWYFWEYVMHGEFDLGYGYIVALGATGFALASLAVTIYQNRSARVSALRGLLLTWSVREREAQPS